MQATKQTIIVTSTVKEFDHFMNKWGLNPSNKDFINVCTCHYSGQEILGNRRLGNYNIIYCENWREGMYWQEVEAMIKQRRPQVNKRDTEAGLGAGSIEIEEAV